MPNDLFIPSRNASRRRYLTEDWGLWGSVPLIGNRINRAHPYLLLASPQLSPISSGMR
ncbi:hypothetical protein QFZ34_000674 [Phyllobacterium ifriqiyense]|uniref:Uncharacterized protein n=1 Tax=Phyllobacterium ifriqiyense TaxID=314238 RepID=A0ABU0S411_9HYPH|nr:hypothetical protein [Phyllobacterium ifriqiyense]